MLRSRRGFQILRQCQIPFLMVGTQVSQNSKYSQNWGARACIPAGAGGIRFAPFLENFCRCW